MCAVIEILKEYNLYEPFKEAIHEVIKEHHEACAAKEARTPLVQKHLDEQEAKKIVHTMFHYLKGRKYIGENYTMTKAEEVFDKYSLHNTGATIADVYVAINAQFHDYCELFYNWFGHSDIDECIIESAVKFWFDDEDYKGSKVYKYFKG
jgi:hypothetical protein